MSDVKDAPNPKKFSKSAFISAAKNGQERLILTVLLEDEKLYSKKEVEKAVEEWKKKEATEQ